MSVNMSQVTNQKVPSKYLETRVHNLFAIANRIAFIFIKYGRQ